MIRRAFGESNSVIKKAKLYTSLIRSQLAYCSIIWCPYLIQDIIKLESIQRRATKFIIYIGLQVSLDTSQFAPSYVCI